MTELFAPQDVKLLGPDGRNHFSDIWGLTCTQLGVTATELLRVLPDAQFTPTDLAGYHFIAHGVGVETVEETIDILQNMSIWNEWDKADLLRAALPKILGDRTVAAPIHRIRLGTDSEARDLILGEDVADIFDLVEETDHVQKVKSIYPKPGIELTYKGRASLNMGRVVINQFVVNLVVNSDLLETNHTETGERRSVAAMSTNSSVIPPVRSITIA